MGARSRAAARRRAAESGMWGDPNALPDYKCGHYGHRAKTTGRLCRQNVVSGTTRCPHHAGKPLEQHRALGQITLEGRAFLEPSKWTLAGHEAAQVDPRITILKLIAFWQWKCDQYGELLRVEYETAAALGIRVDGERIVSLDNPEWEHDGDDLLPEHPALQVARHAVENTFHRGGTAAFIGHEYDVDRNGRVFAVKESIRGLVDLEQKAHTMLGKFCQLAINAKIAESRVQLDQQVGVMIQAVILGSLRDLSIHADDRVMEIIAANIDQVANSANLGRAA